MNVKHWHRLVAGVLVGALAVAASSEAMANSSDQSGDLAPLYLAEGGRWIADHYVVVLKEGSRTDDPARQQAAVERAEKLGIKIDSMFGAAILGYAATLTADQIDLLRHDADVEFVAADILLTGESPAVEKPKVLEMDDRPNWGLDRIDQHALPLNNTYNFDTTGNGVTVYVIGSGIRTTHNEFGGRASEGFSTIVSVPNTEDCFGSGTHAAAIVGGSFFGVAKQVNLVSVRIQDCAGFVTYSAFLAGVNWVTANHVKPAVALVDMSFRHGFISINSAASFDRVVGSSIKSGVVYVAGSGLDYACSNSPGRVPAMLTVATSNQDDDIGYPNGISWTGLGECVDVFAPGESITSAWYTSNQGICTCRFQGTGAAHAAGVAALYLQAYPNATPAAISSMIIESSTKNALKAGAKWLLGSPNRLLFSRFAIPVTVPDVRGKTLAEATQLLNNAQLVVGNRYNVIVHESSDSGRVVQQSLMHGKLVVPGTAVDLGFGQFTGGQY